jgi:hypothetical protein
MKEMTSLLKKRQVHLDLFEKLWKENHLDALISPVWSGPAYKPEDIKDLSLIHSPAMLQNYAGFPSRALPIT